MNIIYNKQLLISWCFNIEAKPRTHASFYKYYFMKMFLQNHIQNQMLQIIKITWWTHILIDDSN